MGLVWARCESTYNETDRNRWAVGADGLGRWNVREDGGELSVQAPEPDEESHGLLGKIVAGS
jgi:hypothetical protein